MKILIAFSFIFFTLFAYAKPASILSVGFEGAKDILSDNDVECFEAPDMSVSFKLKPTSQKLLAETTEKNIGKNMKIEVCGMGKINPIIAQKIETDSFTYTISRAQLTCLNASSLMKCKTTKH